jgi:hypothetical protein
MPPGADLSDQPQVVQGAYYQPYKDAFPMGPSAELPGPYKAPDTQRLSELQAVREYAELGGNTTFHNPALHHPMTPVEMDASHAHRPVG